VRNLVVILAMLFFLLTPATCLSSQFFITLGPEVRYVNGHSTYHIRFDNPWASGGHGESELEWPLDNWFAGINLLVGSKGGPKNPHQTKGQFNFRLLSRISEDAGTMKDSDWIENDAAYGYPPHPGKDLYGELDAKLEEGVIFDVNYAYNFSLNKSFSIWPMLGLRYTEFKWSGWNLVQRNFGPWVAENYIDTNGWEWIRYEITYWIPYLGVNSEILFGKNHQFRLNLNFGYSNWVDVDDKDTHLYPKWDAANPGFNRDMISEGDCEGEAYILRIEGWWSFRHNWSLDLGGEYIDIDTEGSMQQKQYINGTLIGVSGLPIKDTVTSAYWSGIVKISYEF
jgi:hypothetical protein